VRKHSIRKKKSINAKVFVVQMQWKLQRLVGEYSHGYDEYDDATNLLVLSE
jgi:hypothetical protein